METEIDLGLDLAQWETLKALGAPNPDYRRMNQLAFQQLVAQELAAMLEGHPIITPMGARSWYGARPSYGAGRPEAARSIPVAKLIAAAWIA